MIGSLFTSGLASGVLIPSMLMAGVACMLIPLLIRLLVHRRVVSMPWGAMRLLQDSIRWRSRTRLLRILLFLVRTCIPLCAAAVVAGVWFGESALDARKHVAVVLVDDTINAWVEGADGRRGIDEHIETIRTMLGDGEQFDIVTLTGRHLGRADNRSIASIKPSPSAPQWASALKLVQTALSSNEASSHDGVVLLSELRRGLMQSKSTLPSVDRRFVHKAPAGEQRSSTRVMHVKTPRTISLPGDPLASTQLQIDLVRQGPLRDPWTTELTLDQQNPSTGEQSRVDTSSIEWPPGARQHSAFLTLPQGNVDAVFLVSIALHAAPSSKRWIHVKRHQVGEVTLVSESSGQPFDPSLAASWLHTAIEMDQFDGSLQTTHVHPRDLLIDTLDADMPVVVSNAGALSVDTWLTLLDQGKKTPIIVFPSPTADADDLSTLLRALNAHLLNSDASSDSNGNSIPSTLSLLHPSSLDGRITIPQEAGPLELLRPELSLLLSGLQVDRLVDLTPLVESGRAYSLVNRDGYPLFIAFNDAAIVIGAMAWHPSWSDLPLRPAAPAVLQELLRAGVDALARESIIASGANAVTGLNDEGILVQADVHAADQTPGDAQAIRFLKDAGWSMSSDESNNAVPRDATQILGVLLLIMLTLERVLACIIDLPRSHRQHHHLQHESAP